MYKDINKKRIYDNVRLGFEFEFFSPIPRETLAQMIEASLNKKVIWTDEYHSDIPVTENEFKIEPDFSGGFKMNELVTGVMPYDEAIHIMYKMMNFIDENGFTTDRTGLHINISFNEFDLGLNEKIQNLNVFKYILSFDEAKVFEMWPSAKSRIQKVYKNSVANIYPKNKFIAETSINYAKPESPLEYNYPQSKYFGLNFEKLSKGYLEVRYAGGTDYQLRRADATGLINYIAESLVETLNSNSTYTIEERKKVSDSMKLQKEVVNSIKTYEKFVAAYPKIELYVDLVNDPRIIEANYQNLRESLFDLIVFGGLSKGMINYDSLTERVQLKDSAIKEGFGIKDMDFINCSVEAELKDCMLYGCKVRSSHLSGCKLFTENDVRYCHLEDCIFERSGNNRVDMSYIKCIPDTVIHAKLNECVVRSGIISLDSEVDKKTEIISGTGKGSKTSDTK